MMTNSILSLIGFDGIREEGKRTKSHKGGRKEIWEAGRVGCGCCYGMCDDMITTRMCFCYFQTFLLSFPTGTTDGFDVSHGGISMDISIVPGT